ncbi:hypothetical protein BSKO_08921 [Bryopsis sp. KO-2023]|nr:hypothetical protein BSKO_08921 [Bryopsis sp. KO-2023]
MSKREKKEEYHTRLCEFLEEYDKCFIVHADNVGSKQFMDIRRGLRPDSTILMGKNTMMKRSIRLYCEQSGNDDWSAILESLQGNVGIVFTKGELADVKEEIGKYKVGAPARVGALAPKDVVVPAGGTGMDPSQTSFFQALGIATKINKGTIEIVTDVNLVSEGDKVGGSEATLLSKLGIKPFEYGLVIQKVYESGTMYDPEVLDITEDDLMGKALAAISNVAALSLQAGYPTLPSIPHSVINGFKNVLSVALGTEYSFPQADKIREMLENPEAFMAAAAPADAPAAAADAPAAAEEEEEEESEEEGGMFDLFG